MKPAWYPHQPLRMQKTTRAFAQYCRPTCTKVHATNGEICTDTYLLRTTGLFGSRAMMSLHAVKILLQRGIPLLLD